VLAKIEAKINSIEAQIRNENVYDENIKKQQEIIAASLVLAEHRNKKQKKIDIAAANDAAKLQAETEEKKIAAQKKYDDAEAARQKAAAKKLAEEIADIKFDKDFIDKALSIGVDAGIQDELTKLLQFDDVDTTALKKLQDEMDEYRKKITNTFKALEILRTTEAKTAEGSIIRTDLMKKLKIELDKYGLSLSNVIVSEQKQRDKNQSDLNDTETKIQQQGFLNMAIQGVADTMNDLARTQEILNGVRNDASSSIDDVKKAEEDAAKARKRAIAGTIKALIAETIALAVRNALASSVAAGPFAVAIGAAAGGAAALLMSSIIPSFAEGAVVNGPTLAMVGDAPGVNNPEFISPRKDMIRDIQNAVNGASGGAAANYKFVIRGEDLVTVLDNENQYRDVI